MGYTITSEDIGDDILLFKIENEFDVYCAVALKPQIDDQFFEQNKKYLMIDISQTDYIDSSALGVLVSIIKQCQNNEQQQQLFILGPPERVSRVLEITGLDRILNIYPTMEDARASI